jgi:hypothetical protein
VRSRWWLEPVTGVASLHLAALFAEQEIDGDALLELREESLRDALGITAFGRRNKILKAVAALHRPAAAGAPMQQLSRARAHTSECTHTITCTWLPVPARARLPPSGRLLFRFCIAEALAITPADAILTIYGGQIYFKTGCT